MRDLYDEIDRLSREMDKQMGRDPYGYRFESRSPTYKTHNGVTYRAASGLCVCHSKDIFACPDVKRKEAAMNPGRYFKSREDLEAEVSWLKTALADAKTELRARPVKTETKEVVKHVDRVRVEYRDKIEDVTNDPRYNIAVQQLVLDDAEKARVRANILSVLFVLGIAGVSPLAFLMSFWILVPVGILSVALGVANSNRMPAWQIREAKQEKLKWEARQNLALEAQMQTYLPGNTTGSM